MTLENERASHNFFQMFLLVILKNKKFDIFFLQGN